MPIAGDNGEVQSIQTGIAHPIVQGTAPICVSQLIDRKQKNQNKAGSQNSLGQQGVHRRPKTHQRLEAIDGLGGNEIPKGLFWSACRSFCLHLKYTI